MILRRPFPGALVTCAGRRSTGAHRSNARNGWMHYVLARSGKLCGTAGAASTRGGSRCRPSLGCRGGCGHDFAVGVAMLSAACCRPGISPRQWLRNATNNTYKKLLGCVTLDGVREHQAAFQAIADANDDPFIGVRALPVPRATPTASLRSRAVRQAGYDGDARLGPVTFNFPAVLHQCRGPATYKTGVFAGSGSGTSGAGHPSGHQPHPARPRPAVAGGGLRGWLQR